MDRDELAFRVWEKLLSQRQCPTCLEELARQAARIADILHAETSAQMVAGFAAGTASDVTDVQQ